MSNATGQRGSSCANDACVAVDATAADGSITLTSTIDGNDGAVTYTADEWAVFHADMVAGRYAHTTRAVPATV